MKRVLISACLLGENVRYDAKNCKKRSEIIEKWQKEDRVISLCPEVAGGLSVPRLPAEIQANGRITNIEREDVTEAFKQGARRALKLCCEHDITIAILKEGSPSCGTSRINDGAFSGNKIAGAGITTRLLRDNGIQVFGEHELEQAAALLGD